ncbi:hypothetical protein Tco_0412375 [Tanacetum coccineum]
MLEAETYLDAYGLRDTIQAGKVTTSMQKAKALMSIPHRLHVDLKIEYLTVKDPLVLWNKLKDIFDHQKTQQYQAKGFTKYCDLIACLLLTEQNDELLMRNHETRPTGVAPLPKANMETYNDHSGGRGRRYGCGRGRGRGYDRGQGRGFCRGNYYGVNHGVQFKNTSSHNKWQDKEKNENDGDEKEKGVTENSCYRCGRFDHWATHCRTPKHLVALYQKYIKNRENEMESNFVYDDRDDIPEGHKDQNDATHLDDDEFLTNE